MGDALVARLREGAQWLTRPRHEVCAALITDAADRIEELTALCGWHDPTGADHMEDAARLAVENDELRAENGELAAERDAALTDLGRTQRELDVIHGYIPVLRAERDTLAEMVRLFDPWVTLRVAGHGPYLANRRPAPGEHITLTPEQAERFQRVLDRIYREAETDD